VRHDAGVVDEDVDPPVALPDLLDHRLHLLRLAQVGIEGDDFGLLLLAVLDGLIQ